MKVSDIVIKFLEQKGIDTAFTVSGGGCIHLIDSLRKSNIDVLCPHHEQSALMASEGYYRQSNRMSANIVTTGPGGTNAITGLLGLWLDSIPTIVVSGQVSQNQLSEGTGCRQIGDQEFDIIGVVNDMTPDANTEPPVDAAYQSIVSPVPGVADIITAPVEHLEPSLPIGALEFTVAVTAVLEADKQPVKLILVSAKYIVVDNILGVVNDVTPVPEANTEPPVDALYQSIVSPAPGVANISTVPVEHLSPFVPIGAVGNGFKIAVT